MACRKPEPIDVAFNALCEVGRRDLGMLIAWFDDPESPGRGYIEFLGDPVEELDSWDDYGLIDRAEQLARIYNVGHHVDLRDPVPGVA